jgi:hypothetical protein
VLDAAQPVCCEICGVSSSLIAGKPAPTIDWECTTFVFDLNPCRSGLARDDGLEHTRELPEKTYNNSLRRSP